MLLVTIPANTDIFFKTLVYVQNMKVECKMKFTTLTRELIYALFLLFFIWYILVFYYRWLPFSKCEAGTDLQHVKTGLKTSSCHHDLTLALTRHHLAPLLMTWTMVWPFCSFKPSCAGESSTEEATFICYYYYYPFPTFKHKSVYTAYQGPKLWDQHGQEGFQKLKLESFLSVGFFFFACWIAG